MFDLPVGEGVRRPWVKDTTEQEAPNPGNVVKVEGMPVWAGDVPVKTK